MTDLYKSGSKVFPIFVPDKSELKSVNFYLIMHEGSLSLIDAGYDNEKCWEALLMTLKQNGFGLNDLTEIILTHHHIDHVGLVNRIVSKHPIPVYASSHSIPRLKRDKTFLEMRVEFFSKLYNEFGCAETGEKHVANMKKSMKKNKDKIIQADITSLKDDSLLHFKLIDVPGHSPDQIAFLDESRKWLFSGDLLIKHISSNAIVEPDNEGNRLSTLIQHMDSLERCASLDIDIVFPGHGTLIQQPVELIRTRLNRIDEKSIRLIHLIQSGVTTASELAYSFYKKTYYEQFGLVMSEIIGQLDYLEANNKINKEFVQGIWHYSVTKDSKYLMKCN